MSPAPLEETGIAIIGMAGRFPGAASVEALWPIVREGRDVVSRFDVADLAAVEPDPSVLSQPNYVGARGLLEGADLFDAEFFDYAPAEATHIDPQHRVWLEVAWEALESAGYAHARHSQIVSVFAGSFGHNYLLHSLLPDRNAVEEYVRARRAAAFALMVQNDSAHLPTRTAQGDILKNAILSHGDVLNSAAIPLELKREMFALLSGAVARQIKKKGLSEKDVLADFERWRKERREDRRRR